MTWNYIDIDMAGRAIKDFLEGPRDLEILEPIEEAGMTLWNTLIEYCRRLELENEIQKKQAKELQEACEHENLALEVENNRLRETLKDYGDPNNWQDDEELGIYLFHAFYAPWSKAEEALKNGF